jgi:acetyl-CoA acetyltransferase
MSTEVYIAGAAMTPFGRHNGLSMQDLTQAAVLGAITDAGVDPHEVQAFYAANVYGGMVLGQVLLRDLGFTGPPLYNVENACASGATAVHLARQALQLGLYDTVVVWGVEQLTALGGGTIPLQRNDYKTALYAEHGMTLPTVYAMRGSRYLHERNLGMDVLARVAVKNRANGARNPLAQQQTLVTLEEVMASRPIAEPLTLLQCCPSAVDGAAALVLTTKKPTTPTRYAFSARRCSLDISNKAVTIYSTPRSRREPRAWPMSKPASARKTWAWSNFMTPSRSPNFSIMRR